MPESQESWGFRGCDLCSVSCIYNLLVDVNQQRINSSSEKRFSFFSWHTKGIVKANAHLKSTPVLPKFACFRASPNSL